MPLATAGAISKIQLLKQQQEVQLAMAEANGLVSEQARLKLAISQAKSQAQNATDLSRQQWLNQGAKGLHSAAHYGVYAFKPQMPLSFIDRGVEAYTGAAVWLEAHKQNDFRYRPAQDQTAVARFGELTAATVLQILLPLFNNFAGIHDVCRRTRKRNFAAGFKSRHPPFAISGGQSFGHYGRFSSAARACRHNRCRRFNFGG